MNFIAHYHLYQSNNLHQVTGNLLPDLMRGFSKIYNQSLQQQPNWMHPKLYEGISFHLKVDDFFHKEDFFLKSCEKINEKLDKSTKNYRRKFIISHVLVELLIDHAIISNQKEIITQFYADVNAIIQNNILAKWELDNQEFNSSNLIRIFKLFNEHRYAQYLTTVSGVSHALHQIIGKKIGVKLNDKIMENIIHEILNDFLNEVEGFLKEFKVKLHV